MPNFPDFIIYPVNPLGFRAKSKVKAVSHGKRIDQEIIRGDSEMSPHDIAYVDS